MSSYACYFPVFWNEWRALPMVSGKADADTKRVRAAVDRVEVTRLGASNVARGRGTRERPLLVDNPFLWFLVFRFDHSATMRFQSLLGYGAVLALFQLVAACKYHIPCCVTCKLRAHSLGFSMRARVGRKAASVIVQVHWVVQRDGAAEE